MSHTVWLILHEFLLRIIPITAFEIKGDWSQRNDVVECKITAVNCCWKLSSVFFITRHHYESLMWVIIKRHNEGSRKLSFISFPSIVGDRLHSSQVFSISNSPELVTVVEQSPFPSFIFFFKSSQIRIEIRKCCNWVDVV